MGVFLSKGGIPLRNTKNSLKIQYVSLYLIIVVGKQVSNFFGDLGGIYNFSLSKKE